MLFLFLFLFLVVFVGYIIPSLSHLLLVYVEKFRKDLIVEKRSWFYSNNKYRLFYGFIPIWNVIELSEEFDYIKCIWLVYKKKRNAAILLKKNPQLAVLDLLDELNSHLTDILFNFHRNYFNNPTANLLVSDFPTLTNDTRNVKSFLRKNYQEDEVIALLEAHEMPLVFCKTIFDTKKFTNTDKDYELLFELFTILNNFNKKGIALNQKFQEKDKQIKNEALIKAVELEEVTTNRLINEAKRISEVHNLMERI